MKFTTVVVELHEFALNKRNVCGSHRCTSCCYDTEMMLLEEDIERIVGLGYKEDLFAAGLDQFKVLRNSSAGRCVFHDGKGCTIYENRPKGCKLYPVVYDEDLSLPVRDVSCPYRNEFRITSKAKKELPEIYRNLISERRNRLANV